MLHLQDMKPIWGHKAVKWVFSHLSYAVLILADWKQWCSCISDKKKILAFNNQMLTQVYLCFSSSKKVYDLIPSHRFFCLHSHFMCSEWHIAPTCLHLLRLQTPPHPNTQREKMLIKRHKITQVRLSCLTVSTVMQEVDPCAFKGWVYRFGLKMINLLFLGELWNLCKNLHKTKLNDSSYCHNKCLKASAFILTRRVDSPSLLTFLYRSATLL